VANLFFTGPYAANGVNLMTMLPSGAPIVGDDHGTRCARVAAAVVDNTRGIAGVAGR
jgi:hypothetical protein